MDIRVHAGGLRSLLRGGTGEIFQMAFGGQGYVLVQPSESVVQGGPAGAAAAAAAGSGGLLGG